MTIKKVKASVLLPVYNAEVYLKLAIDSVLRQTYKDFELLLLNDGSSDASEQIIDQYIKKDERCKKLSWENIGLIKTLNKGLENAQGEIIFRMDADDICHPQRFEKQLAYLENNPECIALGSRVLLIDDDGMPIKIVSVPSSHEDIEKRNFVGNGSAIVHPSVAMRKDAVMEINGYREQYAHAEDIDLFLRLAEKGKVANLPDILLEYRQHASSIGYSKRKEQLISINKAIDDAICRRNIIVAPPQSLESFLVTQNISEIYRKWAWWSLQGGNKMTARKYLFKTIQSDPFNISNIKLLLCVMRGY